MWMLYVVFILKALVRSQLLPPDSVIEENVNVTEETIRDIVTEHETYSTSETIEQQYPDTDNVQTDVTFMAAVLYLDNYLLGTGAVVADKWIVVTAFQLGSFKPRQLRVRVGSKSPLSGGQLLPVTQLYVHPMFYQFNNDVALLKTMNVIELGLSVNLVPVAPNPPSIGDHASFHYWTESSVESKQVDILPVSECRVFYPSFELTESNICIVLDQVLPHQVTLYGSPLTFNGSLVGLYMGLEADTFKPPLCVSLSPLVNWIHLMTTNETDALRIFPLL